MLWCSFASTSASLVPFGDDMKRAKKIYDRNICLCLDARHQQKMEIEYVVMANEEQVGMEQKRTKKEEEKNGAWFICHAHNLAFVQRFFHLYDARSLQSPAEVVSSKCLLAEKAPAHIKRKSLYTYTVAQFWNQYGVSK